MAVKTITTNDINFGQILIPNPSTKISTFHFPIDSLQYWYPFDSRYTVKYVAQDNRVYIAPNSNLAEDFCSYGISSKTNRSIAKTGCCSAYSLYIEEVYLDNLNVIEYCKINNIVTLNPCSKKELAQSFSIILDKIDKLSNEILLRDTDITEDILGVLQTREREHERIEIFNKHVTLEDEKLFLFYGKVLTMLHLVRKYYCRTAE